MPNLRLCFIHLKTSLEAFERTQQPATSNVAGFFIAFQKGLKKLLENLFLDISDNERAKRRDFVITLRISEVHCSVAEMNLGRENFSFI
ncbi:MAG TPA: hypothetical protein DCX32_03280 [Candidatus Moranbacteria bacterium]|nr:MAG: hypothetical protein UW95_C0030G0009 [Parcubacteria group bacterium GW2011_GWC1_45_14]HAV11541.1 hypothetical protein [Candidatus Moranbacteria bacterium]